MILMRHRQRGNSFQPRISSPSRPDPAMQCIDRSILSWIKSWKATAPPAPPNHSPPLKRESCGGKQSGSLSWFVIVIHLGSRKHNWLISRASCMHTPFGCRRPCMTNTPPGLPLHEIARHLLNHLFLIFVLWYYKKYKSRVVFLLLLKL